MHWSKKTNENKEAAERAAGTDVDVLFLGDSITEGWLGLSMGFPNGRKSENLKVFQSLFSVEEGGEFEGLALGISGDTVSVNVIISIMQEEEANNSPTTVVSWPVALDICILKESKFIVENSKRRVADTAKPICYLGAHRYK